MSDSKTSRRREPKECKNKVFAWTALWLLNIAKCTKTTYNEINIIVYYFFIPLSWAVMGDVLVRFPIFTPIVLIGWILILILTRGKFSRWCDNVFRLSARFLVGFRHVGLNYEQASVVVCVVLPIAIYAGLIWLLSAK